MELLTVLAGISSCVTGIGAALILLLRPVREALTGTKHLREGQVLEHVYPNVEVCINNSKLVTKEEFDKIEFKEKDKAVVMLSMK